MTVETVRDQYRARVYRAEKITAHVVLGCYWVQTIPDEDISGYLNAVLSDARVVARWGRMRYKIRLTNRGNSAYADFDKRTIVLSKNTRNPITILHEAAHIMSSCQPGAIHGAAFLAAYRFLLRIGLGDEAARVFTASIMSMGLSISDTHLPPIRDEHHRQAQDPFPGFTADQINTAAEVLATAARSGVFGEPGDPQRRTAFAMARTLNKHKTGRPFIDTPALPQTVTITTADLLAVDTPEEVAGLVLTAVKNATNSSRNPKPVTATVSAAKAAAKKVAKKPPAGRPATPKKPRPEGRATKPPTTPKRSTSRKTTR